MMYLLGAAIVLFVAWALFIGWWNGSVFVALLLALAVPIGAIWIAMIFGALTGPIGARWLLGGLVLVGEYLAWARVYAYWKRQRAIEQAFRLEPGPQWNGGDEPFQGRRGRG